ncbi:unnamed protein product [Protopolystoma xenopodis]|uniref:Uncharacterized protein n=1 Tax=Protopolystoma xenopodis TaxID=117903 RepID=A0A3S5BFM2_9PLAT|nr:unnamed protein product [Protopolystoma xenopodis]
MPSSSCTPPAPVDTTCRGYASSRPAPTSCTHRVSHCLFHYHATSSSCPKERGSFWTDHLCLGCCHPHLSSILPGPVTRLEFFSPSVCRHRYSAVCGLEDATYQTTGNRQPATSS